MRSTCKRVQKASGATGNILRAILCSRPFRSPRECKEGRQATTLCWDTARQSQLRPTNKVPLKYSGAGLEAGEPQSSKPHDFLLFFLLPTTGGRQYGAGESLLIKWSSTSRQSWWSPILALQRLRGSKQAIKQPTLFFLSPCNTAGQGQPGTPAEQMPQGRYQASPCSWDSRTTGVSHRSRNVFAVCNHHNISP